MTIDNKVCLIVIDGWGINETEIPGDVSNTFIYPKNRQSKEPTLQ
jgi:bisphosphoglycerate-independent phosphoglycerate mutase (AlkP superfamily)